MSQTSQFQVLSSYAGDLQIQGNAILKGKQGDEQVIATLDLCQFLIQLQNVGNSKNQIIYFKDIKQVINENKLIEKQRERRITIQLKTSDIVALTFEEATLFRKFEEAFYNTIDVEREKNLVCPNVKSPPRPTKNTITARGMQNTLKINLNLARNRTVSAERERAVIQNTQTQQGRSQEKNDIETEKNTIDLLEKKQIEEDNHLSFQETRTSTLNSATAAIDKRNSKNSILSKQIEPSVEYTSKQKQNENGILEIDNQKQTKQGMSNFTNSYISQPKSNNKKSFLQNEETSKKEINSLRSSSGIRGGRVYHSNKLRDFSLRQNQQDNNNSNTKCLTQADEDSSFSPEIKRGTLKKEGSQKEEHSIQTEQSSNRCSSMRMRNRRFGLSKDSSPAATPLRQTSKESVNEDLESQNESPNKKVGRQKQMCSDPVKKDYSSSQNSQKEYMRTAPSLQDQEEGNFPEISSFEISSNQTQAHKPPLIKRSIKLNNNQGSNQEKNINSSNKQTLNTLNDTEQIINNPDTIKISNQKQQLKATTLNNINNNSGFFNKSLGNNSSSINNNKSIPNDQLQSKNNSISTKSSEQHQEGIKKVESVYIKGNISKQSPTKQSIKLIQSQIISENRINKESREEEIDKNNSKYSSNSIALISSNVNENQDIINNSFDDNYSQVFTKQPQIKQPQLISMEECDNILQILNIPNTNDTINKDCHQKEQFDDGKQQVQKQIEKIQIKESLNQKEQKIINNCVPIPNNTSDKELKKEELYPQVKQGKQTNEKQVPQNIETDVDLQIKKQKSQPSKRLRNVFEEEYWNPVNFPQDYKVKNHPPNLNEKNEIMKEEAKKQEQKQNDDSHKDNNIQSISSNSNINSSSRNSLNEESVKSNRKKCSLFDDIQFFEDFNNKIANKKQSVQQVNNIQKSVQQNDYEEWDQDLDAI